MMNKYLLLFWMIICPAIAFASHAKLTDVHIQRIKDDIRIALSLDQKTHQQIFALSQPPRLVVDLKDTKLATSLKNLDLTATPIKNIRIGYPGRDVTRVVFDLQAPMKFSMWLQESDNAVVINLHPFARTKKISSSHMTQPTVTKQPAAHSVVVVIDPGHGGYDPGAIGSHGTKEKNVTLAISRRLAYLINQQPNMRAVLTRNGDYYVGLRGRLKVARQRNADLFIALHADSYFNNHAEGASVYALSQHGATSEAARWLAQRDNYSELGGVDLRDLSDQSYLLRSVLIDLAQTATITDSLRLGTVMLSNLRSMTKLHYSRVEQAPFMVLKSPDIPSILVEMGFISNSNEERRLSDENYQNKIALALFNSIYVYLKKSAGV